MRSRWLYRVLKGRIIGCFEYIFKVLEKNNITLRTQVTVTFGNGQ